MFNVLFILLQITFCNQKVDLNTKIIKCNIQIETKEFNKLKRFKEVELLDLSNSSFNDLKQLKELKQLKFLSLENTKIKKLENIDYLINLKELSIHNNKIFKIKKLMKLKSLQYLFINEININNTDIFLSMKKLRFIQTLKKFSNFNNNNFVSFNNNIYGLLNNHIIGVYNMLKIKINYASKIELIKFNRIDLLINGYFFKRNFINKELLFEIMNKMIERNEFWNINKLNKLKNSALDYAYGEYYRIGENDFKIKYNAKRNLELYNLLKQHGALRGKEILKIQKDTQKIIDFILSLNLKQKMLNLFHIFYWNNK